ncbi:MAG: TIM barrel protein [Bacillota bacterium]|nr:TIM barrel protein [Bacillota bacterium]
MRESIHKYFKVGTLLWMSYPRTDSVTGAVKIAKDDYFDAIEVTQCPDEAERAKLQKILAASHLSVGYGAMPNLLGPKLNPNDTDEGERKKAEGVLLRAIDEAEYLGSKGIAFLSGKWKEETKETAYQQLLKTTGNVCDYAAKKGMFVELEVFDYDVDKGSLIGPSALAARFAADVRIKHANFGLLVDLSHIPLCHEVSADVIRVCRPYITHFHIGNAVADPDSEDYGDHHPRFGYPNSANDVEELYDYLKVLKEEGFFRKEQPMFLSMEVAPKADEDEDIVLANTKRCLNRAWAMLED